MFLFLPVICQSHTNLLHGLTHFWRVISERIHKRKTNSHFKTQRHLSEILCRSSSSHSKLSGHFPFFYTNDLYHFSTVSHSQTPWKKPLGTAGFAATSYRFSRKPAQVNLLQILWGPAWKGRDEAASGTRWIFQKWPSDCRRSWENADWVTCWPTD